ncbi:endonuclease III domain-containing protein [Acidihalobacter prosperus]|uniref:Endonuclease n=1 Tax=Acidihalobacter prosperus TaxID=160660 RepID=A0A1A6C7D3_9GAMM|nr:endonuclease [Acidihalobacter prosperus]OBS10459.1 endonuclease [Acidihalobacter prosperus]
MSVPASLDAARAGEIFERLLVEHGEQHWWPAETPFEVMLGAILIQNTRWRNVERALGRLRDAGLLGAVELAALPPETLAEHLRPVGYYNLKARRVAGFADWYLARGGYEGLRLHETAHLREALLAVDGVGPETADDILLYAFERPVFVIDAYTRRLFGRLGLLPEKAAYERLRRAFEACLPPDAYHYGEYHALIVAHAKALCRPRPRCVACPLRSDCPAGGD